MAKVWVPDAQDGYVLADLVSSNNDGTTTVSKLGVETVLPESEVFAVNPHKFDKVEDMSQLGHLSDATVLHNLRQRYYANAIYTYSGLFCVVINPYKLLPIYNAETVERYKGKRREEIEPHIFTVADEAYRSLVNDGVNQSMLITGESGAGKTVNTKKVIQYLAYIAGRQTESGERGELEEQLIQANPILESFGNAKTIRNDNSSRFGKFIEIQFTKQGLIAGGVITSYLLEKSRIVYQAENERNFHVFYHLLASGDAAMLEELHLTSIADYKWLSVDSAVVPGMDDTEEYEIVKAAWETMGVSREDQMLAYRIVAAILHLGNAEFSQSRRSEDAQADDACRQALNTAETLLGLTPNGLVKAILKPRLKAGGEWVNKSRTAPQAQYVVEAMAKSLYERLFAWIVERINVSLQNRHKRELFIGVLDISGFEIFDVNSFEQLCINYTNEKLQQFFNHHMFNLEQEEYMREGIEWDMIDFGLDLEPTITLIESASPPYGVLALLNEECTFPRATDETFVEKLVSNHGGDSEGPFSVPKFAKNKFSVAHYAGNVEYTVDDWLEKNRDKLDDPVTVVLQDSAITFVGDLFDDLHPDREGSRSVNVRGKRSRARPFIASHHKTQLLDLMATLKSTTPHFIRCIKPNEEKKAGVIDAHMVLDQLRCNGVLEGIRICRKGFPNRIPFSDFRDRYKILAPGKVPDSMLDSKKACQIIVDAVGMDPSQYRIGLSKVFFKAGRLPELEELRDEILSKMLVKLQGVVRGALARKQYAIMLSTSRAMALVQQSIRLYLKARDWGWWQLFAKIKPMLKHQDVEAELAAKDDEIKAAESRAKAAESKSLTLSNELADASLKLEEAREKFKREKDSIRDNYEAQLEGLSDKVAQLTDARASDKAAAAAQLQLANDEAASRLAAALDAAARDRDAADKARAQAEADARAAADAREAAARKQLEAANAAANQARNELNATHNTEVRELTARLQKAKSEASSASAAKAAGDDEISALRSKLAAANARISELEDSLEDALAKGASSESARAQLAAQYSASQSSLTTEASARAAMEQAKLLLETKVADLTAQLDDANSALNSASAKASDLNAQLEEAHDDYETAMRKSLESDKALKALKKQLADAQAEASAASQDAARSKRAASKATRELRAAKATGMQAGESSSRPMSSSSGAMTKDAMNATLKISNLKLALDAAERRSAKAGDEVERLNGELAEARADVQEAENATLGAETDRDLLKVELAEEEALVASLRDQLGAMQAELDLARSANADVAAHAEAMGAKKAKRWTLALEQTREALEDAREDVAGAERALDAEKKAHAETKAELAELAAASSSAMTSAAESRRTIAELKEQVESLTSERESLAAREASTKDELGAAREALALGTLESSDSSRLSASLQRDLEMVQEQLEDAAAALEEKEVALRIAEDALFDAEAKADEEEAEAAALKEDNMSLLEEIALLKGSASTASSALIAQQEVIIEGLNQELEGLRDALEDEQRKTMAAERAKRTLKSKADEAEDALHSAQSALEAALAGKSAAEEDARGAKLAASAAEEKALGAALAAKEAETAANDVQVQVSNLKEANAGLEKAKKDAVAAHKDTLSELEEQVAITETVERSKRLLQDEIHQVKEELEDAREERAKVESARIELAGRITELQAELANRDNSKEVELSAQLRDARASITRLQLVVAQLEGSQNMLKKATTKAESASASSRDSAATAESKARAAAKATAKAQAEAAAASAEATSRAKALKVAERQKASVVTELNELKARFEVLSRTKRSIESSKAALENQLEDLRDALQVEAEGKAKELAARRSAQEEIAQLRDELDSGSHTEELIAELKRSHILELAAERKKLEAEAAAQIEVVSKARREAKAAADELREDLEEARNEKAIAAKQVDRLSSELQASRAKMTNVKKELSRAEAALREARAKVKDLTNEASSSRAVLDAAVSDKRALLLQVNDLSSRLEDAEREAASAQLSGARLQTDLEALQDDYDELAASAEESAQRASLLEAEKADLVERLAEEEEERTLWASQKDELESGWEAAKADLEDRVEELLEELKEEQDRHQKSVQVLTEKVESSEGRAVSLESELRSALMDLDDARLEAGRSKSAAAAAQKAANRATTEAKVMEAALATAESSAAEAKEAAKAHAEENKELQEEVDVATRKASADARLLEARADQIAALNEELAEEQGALSALHSTAVDLETMVDSLRGKLNDAEELAAAEQAGRAAQEDQIEALHKELASLDASNVALEKKMIETVKANRDLAARLERTAGLGRSALTGTVQRLEMKVESLEGLLKETKAGKLEQQKRAQKSEKALKRAEATVREVKKVLAMKEKVISSKEGRIVELRADLSESVREEARLEVEVKGLKARIAEGERERVSAA